MTDDERIARARADTWARVEAHELEPLERAAEILDGRPNGHAIDELLELETATHVRRLVATVRYYHDREARADHDRRTLERILERGLSEGRR
jgi:hypothetical protein